MRQTTTTSAPALTNVVLSDVNAVIPAFSSLVSSYRLLVGAAEEIKRLKDVPEEIFRRAVLRFDHCGTLIDIFLELLCCKIAFSSDFLSISCAPLDIFQLVTTGRFPATNTPLGAAELIVQLELVRRLLEHNCDHSCFDKPPIRTPPESCSTLTTQTAIKNILSKQSNQTKSPCPPSNDDIPDDVLQVIINEALANIRQRK